MPDFLLCIPPISQVNYPYIAAPTLKAILEHHGFSAALNDANMTFFNYIRQKTGQLFPETNWNAWNEFYLNWDPLRIDDEFTISWVATNLTPEVLAVGFSVLSWTAYPWTLQAAVIIKNVWPRINVILGGAFFDPEIAQQTLKRCSAIDAVAVGESDIALAEYLEALQRRDVAAAARVSGFAVRTSGGEVALNLRSRSSERTLFSPFADFTELPLDGYLDYRLGTRILPILGSRGCVGRCAFCAERRIWGNYRSRPPEEIVGEMEHQIKRHATEVFRFNDSLLNADTDHLESLCDLLIERQMGVQWAGNARVHRNLSPPLLEKMRRAGCQQLWYGLESASPRILSLMRKDASIDTAARVIRDTKEAGILVLLFLIAEFPGEQLADTRATIDFLEKNAASIDAIHISEYKLIKNSVMYEEAEKFGIFIEGADQFGVPIWAINTHTTRNRVLLEQVQRHLWDHPQTPWPVVGGI
jgi:radical SAM superfamily enzyme YgiQ (UPF0313 family)